MGPTMCLRKISLAKIFRTPLKPSYHKVQLKCVRFEDFCLPLVDYESSTIIVVIAAAKENNEAINLIWKQFYDSDRNKHCANMLL